MERSVIVKSHEFDPNLSTITLSKIHFSGGGFGMVDLKYLGNALMIKTPKVTTPFGFSRGFPGSPFYGKKMELQVNLDSSTVNNVAFSKSLNALQEIIVQNAYENRNDWALFGNRTETANATLDDVREKFVPFIRSAKSPDYPDTLKLAFKTYTDKKTGKIKVTTDCHDAENSPLKQVDEETIPRRSQVLLVIRAKNVWVSPEGTFGLKWQIERCRVYPPEEKPQTREGEATFSFSAAPSGLLLDSDDEGDGGVRRKAGGGGFKVSAGGGGGGRGDDSEEGDDIGENLLDSESD